MRGTSPGIVLQLPFLILDKPAFRDKVANGGGLPSPVSIFEFDTTRAALTFVNVDRGSHIARALAKLLLFSASSPLKGPPTNSPKKRQYL